MEPKNAVAIAVIAAIGLLLAVALINPSIPSPPDSSQNSANPKRVQIPDMKNQEIVHAVQSEKTALGRPLLGSLQEAGAKSQTELTVYNAQSGYSTGYALVKETRELELKSGLNEVTYKDVASQIDPTSVLFTDLKSADTSVIEQNYEYDIVSKTKILEKYLGEIIALEVPKGDATETLTGRLLAYADGIVLETADGIVNVADVQSIRFPKLPDGLITKPTLKWKVFASTNGKRDIQTTYLTNGINWHADYVALVNANDNAMDFKGWVTVDNQSGTAYPAASLKLVAGDVHRVRPAQPAYDYAYESRGAVASAPAPQQFSEESLFEYHLYTLERTTDVSNNQTKQISLLESTGVPVRKILYYDGANAPSYYYAYGGNKKEQNVEVRLRFANKKSDGLGLPLPKGIIRVYKLDSAGKQQFVGEDQINHTPENNDATLFLGNSFDVTGTRTVLENQQLGEKRWRQKVEITLKNAKDASQEVVIAEHLGTNWSITDKTDAFDKKDAYQIEFTVNVPAKGEKKVSYTVEYQYY